ncbi:holo-ACP synthase [Kytococcus sp. Marseille-QA3725]
MIVSVGTDVVEVERLAGALDRVPGLRDRLFTEVERDLPVASLAARFAAKEAVAKVLGSPPGLGFRQAWIESGEHGRPHLRLDGEAARVAGVLGIARWHVSLTHDGGLAVATVVAEGDGGSEHGGTGSQPRAAHSVDAVRQVERAAGPLVHDGTLMRRAASAVESVVAARLRPGGLVHALVGPGDNGGDALHAVAGLARDGATLCTAVLCADTVHEEGLEAAREAGVRVIDLLDPGVVSDSAVRGLTDAWEAEDVVVDGLFGIGGRPGFRGPVRQLATALDLRREEGTAPRVVAVDLPSGADPHGRTVAEAGDVLVADVTVAPTCLKPVHLAPATRHLCGELVVAPIGLAEPDEAPVLVEHTLAELLERCPRPGRADHKYTRGVVGVVAGSERYPGAAVLTSTAALHTGVGMVRYVGPRRAEDLVLSSCPEVVPGSGRVQAWVLGPGTAPDDAERQQDMRAALHHGEPVVLDAGALGLVQAIDRAGTVVLTPHAGELGELIGWERHRVEADPVGAGGVAAERWGVTVLVKGGVSVVVPSPREQERGIAVAVVDAGSPWLSTAGTGDVLAGVVGGLLALGLPGHLAAELGARLHGRAGRCASQGGPLRASALPQHVSEALRDLP